MIGVVWVGLIGLVIGYWLLMDFGLVGSCAFHYFMHDHVCKGKLGFRVLHSCSCVYENWVFM